MPTLKVAIKAEPETWVENIRTEISAAQTTRLWRDSINMLNTVSESVFSRAAHFILELLQNGEDACARAGHEGRITFQISPERVRITHNGAPFTHDDVSAICGVRSTKRPEQETLGFLGIGFKSVFKITDRPQVHSGGFHFKFDRAAHVDPSSTPWQIVPIWHADGNALNQQSDTVFILPFRKPEFYKQTLEELKRLDVHVFLFLKYLRTVVIIYEAEEKKTIIKNLGEKNRILSLTKNGDPRRFVIFRRVCEVPLEVATDPALEFYKRQHVTKREIVLAFGVDSDGNLESLAEANTLGSVSSFLPLVEERSGAKYLIQGDFLVQPGREAIQYELSWNHWLIAQAAELAKSAIEEFKLQRDWGSQFLPLFACVDYTGQAPFDKLFKPRLHDAISEHLSNAQVHRTEDGTYVAPSNAVYVDDRIAALLNDEDLPLLFVGHTDLKIAGPSSAVESLPASVAPLIKEVTLSRVARNQKLFEAKLKRPNHARWFTAFFRALAESDQAFKEVQTRTSRGRITYYDSPIYVLTDGGSIALANGVYSRNIPDEINTLRKKFPAVEKVLASYKLLHPCLHEPALIEFFGARTHVQSIDFDRICRDVFLPRLEVTSPPPPKEELIAYTRLLQKGPQVYSPIWVLTKNNNLMPSSQVFLSTEYSPAEDWEAGSTYAPQIDFLSAEYLQGVPKSEVINWKNFFTTAGVDEKGENPHVRDFAMLYAQDKLSKELGNFILKDHQQHGYDIDSRRISDGTAVALEIKGLKKDGPVELVGNEPTAAQQAKSKGTLFWLCVVTGVPEHPQLWVIEDPLQVGDFKICTIDVSKWRGHGRRVK